MKCRPVWQVQVDPTNMLDPDDGVVESSGVNTEPQQLPDVVGVVPSSFEDSVQEVNNQVLGDESEEGGCLPDNDNPETAASSQNKRNVTFPADSLVKGYLDPPDPWRNG